jgi:LmbE family N-acetylglucosaminyl deacetylase
VLAAHPDDEVIGASSQLPKLRNALFAYVTDGAPRDGRDAQRHGLTVERYRERRREERDAALALCGIERPRIIELDCPDQQASRRLARLSREVARLVGERRIGAVLTHAYEGGHPDHDAAAFIAHAAAALASRPVPIVEMALYHAGGGELVRGDFLPAAGAAAVAVELTPAQRQAKRALVECHASQRDTLRDFPLDVERFRFAPRYDFSTPPHAGPLWYERHPWGMTGPQFRELAAQALAELGLSPGLR